MVSCVSKEVLRKSSMYDDRGNCKTDMLLECQNSSECSVTHCKVRVSSE